MIGPSQRQRKAPQTSAFSLHHTIRRRRSWHRRLLVASWVALAASLLAWLLPLGLIAHGAVTLGSFALTLVLPVPDATSWALNWIRGRIGLSYLTALEIDPNTDRYGLHRAVVERAEQQARNLPPPRPTAWWLPVLAIALGVLLLPAASLPGLGRGGGGFPGAPRATDTPRASEEAAGVEAFEEQVNPLNQPDDPQRLDSPDGVTDGEVGEAGDQRLQQGEAPTLTDEETLDRFLENLREREPQEPEQQQGAAPPNLQSRPGDGPPPDGAEELSQQPRDPGSEGEPGDERGEGEQSEQTGDQSGEEGQEGENPQADQDPNQSLGPSEGPEGDEQPGFDSAAAPQGELAPEDGSDPGRPDSDEGGGAGDQPSSEQAPPGLEGSEQNDPEFLEGRLGGGPENTGGLVRLPGSDEVDLPGTVAPGDYLRAAEQAVTEGDIPVEYQEVIRNYFR